MRMIQRAHINKSRGIRVRRDEMRATKDEEKEKEKMEKSRNKQRHDTQASRSCNCALMWTGRWAEVMARRLDPDARPDPDGLRVATDRQRLMGQAIRRIVNCDGYHEMRPKTCGVYSYRRRHVFVLINTKEKC